jgi:hypothetical protein
MLNSVLHPVGFPALAFYLRRMPPESETQPQVLTLARGITVILFPGHVRHRAMTGELWLLLLCLRQSQLMAGWLLRMLLSQSEGGLLELLL